MSEEVKAVQEPSTPLEAVYGNNEVVIGDGRRVAVFKMKLRHLKSAVLLVQKVLDRIVAKPETDAAVAPAAVLSFSPSSILQLIADNFEEAVQLIAYHTTLTKDELLDLSLEDTVIIAAGVVKINADFFSREILPLMEAANTMATNSPRL